MPIDLMMSLILCIEAMESRLADERDEKERQKWLLLLSRMDGLLEKCLAGRFSDRDLLARQAEKELNMARKKILRWQERRTRSGELLAEISMVLCRLDGCWAGMKSGN